MYRHAEWTRQHANDGAGTLYLEGSQRSLIKECWDGSTHWVVILTSFNIKKQQQEAQIQIGVIALDQGFCSPPNTHTKPP